MTYAGALSKRAFFLSVGWKSISCYYVNLEKDPSDIEE